MHETLSRFTDGDLLFLTDVLASGSDRSRMLRVLREDEEILRGMLTDERLFDRILSQPEGLVSVSPRLLFCVLMARVRQDLEEETHTVEPGRTVVFDIPRIAALLEDTRIADYLVEVLASFVRVHASSATVRLRRGVWARYRFSDLDLPRMIRHTGLLEEEQRSDWYRRIGDLCLFLAGVFPDSLPAFSPRRAAFQLDRAGFVDNGRRAYWAAARHPRTEAPIALVLGQLADAFDLAVKPLDHMASRYLSPIRDRLFRSPSRGE